MCVGLCLAPLCVESEAAVPPVCSAGYSPALPAPPTSCQEHSSNLRLDAGHKNCLGDRDATVVARGQQLSGHCHKPTEGLDAQVLVAT